jgi:hypothetical protein
MAFAANSDTSGMSRTPSFGFPKTDCQEGLAYPAQVPPTTPLAAGVPVAQLLGPPLPAIVVKKERPIVELQKPFGPKVDVRPL